MHERPEGTEECPLIMVGLNKDRVMSSLEILKDQDRGEKRNISIVKEYNVDNVSSKIVRIIESYTDYVNKVVWKKY